MTTTPTASPELPDLDLDRLEALARAATPQNLDSAQDATKPTGYIECPECGGDGTVELTADYCNYDGKAMGVQFYGIGPEHQAAEAFFRAANPAAVLALVAAARRAQPDGRTPIVVLETNPAGSGHSWVKQAFESAQPEGEAPQAELVADANRYVYLASTADWSSIEDLLRRSTAESVTELKRDLDKLIDARLKTAITLPLYTAPAAQHAESGAPASSLTTVPCPCVAANRTPVCDDCDGQGRLIVDKHDLADHLAAQSQGAPVDSVALNLEAQLRAVVRERDELRVQQAAAPGTVSSDYRKGKIDGLELACQIAREHESFNMPVADAISTQLGMEQSAPGTPEAQADAGIPASGQTAAARDVLAERQRQVEMEGWTPERDDQYDGGELSLAASCYAVVGDSSHFPQFQVPEDWPWDYEWWKPSDDRRNLVKAGALILADIERLDRAAQLDGGQGEGVKV